MGSKALSQAIKEWEITLGKTNVITSKNKLEEAQKTTFPTTQYIAAILKVASTKELIKTVQIANTYFTPFSVMSTGKNWGYGPGASEEENSVLIDLSKMNTIREYNEELGYVTLEPGVTQQQLYSFLKKKKSSFIPSFTGSTGDSSFIGNICERGVGMGQYNFKSRHISNIEVMLPDGKLINTGFGRFNNAKAKNVFPEGFGPSFNDIFLQSNFGIITSLTLFLAPTPKYFQFIDLYIHSDKQLFSSLEIVRKFNFQTNSKKGISFYNDLSFVASKTQYPWKRANNQTPLPQALLNQLKKELDIPFVWRGVIEIYGFTKEEVQTQVNYFTRLVGRKAKYEVSRIYFPRQLDDIPGEIGKMTYWRMKTKPPVKRNPDIDGCGKMRISLALPFTQSAIEEVTLLTQEILAKHDYEPFMEIHCVFERAVLFVTSLLFDRTVEGEDKKALACHDEIVKALVRKGYYPFRPNARAMTLLPKSINDYDLFQQTIKKAVDPKKLFAKGRYERI